MQSRSRSLGLVLSFVLGCSSEAPSIPAPIELSKPAALADTPAEAEPKAKSEPGNSRSERRDSLSSDDIDDGEDEVSLDEQSEGQKRRGARRKSTTSRRRASTRDRAAETASESPRTAKSKVKAPESPTDSGDDEPALAAAAPLTVKRIQFSEHIEGREPQDPEESFGAREIDSLYAFVELDNPSKQKSKITVRFIPPEGSPTKVTLNVGEVSRWRTWALRKNVASIGTWTVVVSDEVGREIGHRTFEVSE